MTLTDWAARNKPSYSVALLDRLEAINGLLVDGHAGDAGVHLGALLDEMQLRRTELIEEDPERIARLEAENKQLKVRAEEAEDGWHGALLKLGRPEQRQTHEVLAEVAATLGKILTTLEHANSAAREGAVSSVQVEETAKGPRVTVKIYAGSVAPVEEAIEDFGRGIRLAQEGQMRNWAATVDSLADKADRRANLATTPEYP